jgi:tetratricopeptide (TPR) repeat protein
MKKQLLTILAALAVSTLLQAQGLKEAIKLTESEQYETAAAAFKRIVAAQPGNGTAYFYFGENYLLADNKDSAMLVFARGLQAEPANPLNHIGLAKVELDNGNEEKGRQLIDEALAQAGTKNALAYIEAADAYIHFTIRNFDKAMQYLDKAAVLEPKNPDIEILYGDIYSEKNNGSAAATHYNRAIDLDKSSVRAIVSKGVLYKRSTNYQGAAEEFRNAIAIDPNFAPAHRELGEAYIKLGDLEKAKAEYKKYLELSSNNCSARIRYASFLYIGKDYAGALAEADQVKQSCDSNNVTLLRVMMYSLYETKDFVRGLHAAERLFAQLPESKYTVTDYEYYGKLLFANEQDSLGAVMLHKGFEKDPLRVDLLQEIGNDFYAIKKYDQAAAAFREKIATGREVKSIDYFRLAQSYFFGQHFLEADTAFNKLCELQPKWGTGFLWNAKNKTRIDSTSKDGLARPFYETYIQIAEDDSVNAAKYTEGLKEAYSYLASYHYLQLKDPAKAVYYLNKKLELLTDPAEQKEIKGIIDQIRGGK